MSDLTDYAKGKPCLIRTPLYCTFRDEETVACHVPLADFHGTALKMADLFIAFGCNVCHAIVDRRAHLELSGAYVRTLHLEGLIRTQAYILERAPHLVIALARSSE